MRKFIVALGLGFLAGATALAESRVTSFHLVDATTNQELRELKDGAEIAIASWSIVVRASEEPKSLRFRLEGPEQLLHVEGTHRLLQN